ncbi:hypothetical protein JHK82_043069 [Glycine max]|nr:hypothetical protein JHK82_043069 [Glycine max]
MSVNGQTLHKDYLDAHIQQGNEGQIVISSGTKLLYELKPDCEAESGPLNNIDNTQEFSPLKCKEAYPSGTKTQQVETSIRVGQTLMMHASHAGDEESDIRESEKEDYKKYIINSKLVNTRSRMQM